MTLEARERGEVEPAPPRIPEGTEETEDTGTGKKTLPTPGAEAGALPMEGLPAEDLPDRLDPLDLPGVVETEEMTTLGEVESFVRLANNSGTKRATLSAPAS